MDLQKSQVLAHQKYISVHIINLIKQLKDFKIYFEKNEKDEANFIDDNKLYLKIISELPKISNFDNEPHPVKKTKTRTYIPISHYYSRGDLQQVILSPRKRSIIQFDTTFTEGIPKREILKNVTHSFLRKPLNEFCQISTFSGNRKIEILRGVEYLSEAEQNDLIDLIENNASHTLNYRIIINGKIPDFLLNRNYHIKRFTPEFETAIDIKHIQNKSAHFIRLLSDICKQKGVKIEAGHSINKYIKNDSFSELLTQFDSQNDLEENIIRLIDSRKNNTIIKLTDALFWYEFIHIREKLKRKTPRLRKQKKIISVKKIKKPPIRNKTLANHSRAIRQKLLELSTKISAEKKIVQEQSIVTTKKVANKFDPDKKILEFQNVKNRWIVILNGNRIRNVNYTFKGIHLIKELVEKHKGADNYIDGDKLNELLLIKLPSKKQFMEKKAATVNKKYKMKKTKNRLVQTEKSSIEVTLNSLRENVKTVAKINKNQLEFLWNKANKMFVFSKQGCYFKPAKGIDIRFSD